MTTQCSDEKCKVFMTQLHCQQIWLQREGKENMFLKIVVAQVNNCIPGQVLSQYFTCGTAPSGTGTFLKES